MNSLHGGYSSLYWEHRSSVNAFVGCWIIAFILVYFVFNVPADIKAPITLRVVAIFGAAL